jgi:hypothetical protein
MLGMRFVLLGWWRMMAVVGGSIIRIVVSILIGLLLRGGEEIGLGIVLRKRCRCGEVESFKIDDWSIDLNYFGVLF